MPVPVIEEMAGAMAAEIVVAAKLALAVADDEDAPAGDLHGEIVAGVGEVRDRPDELPFPGEDAAPFALEDLGRVLPGGGKGELRLRLDGIVHGRIFRCRPAFAKGVRPGL